MRNDPVSYLPSSGSTPAAGDYAQEVYVVNNGTSASTVPVFSGYAGVDSKIAKASAGTFYGVSGYLGAATANRYLMVFDSASVPTNGTGTVPIFVLAIAPNDNFFIDGVNVAMSNGITVVISTTNTTLTIGTAGLTQLTVDYS